VEFLLNRVDWEAEWLLPTFRLVYHVTEKTNLGGRISNIPNVLEVVTWTLEPSIPSTIYYASDLLV
jgi:hypothetical protein